MDGIAIKVEHVSKDFKLPHDKATSLKSSLLNFAKKRRGYELQHALKDVSFEVSKGEFFGIVGRNGSGKSTLLKMIAGIYSPTAGAIQVNGKLTPFIELGVGFNPELTGRENVFLNGALLGFSRKEMTAMYADIVSFAELERFMDQKLKNYSSGMQVRLAFSIAIRANTEILILDEVLAVGDVAFQQKCFDYFEQLKGSDKTVIIVTHDMGAVKRFCNRAILINNGILKLAGSPDEIANQYILDNYEAEKTLPKVENKSLDSSIKSLDLKVRTPLRLTDKDIFEFDISYELSEEMPIYLGIAVMYQNISIAEHNSKLTELGRKSDIKYRVSYRLPLEHFNTGNFKINIAIFKENKEQLIGYKSDACEFFVTSSDKSKAGPMVINGQWEMQE